MTVRFTPPYPEPHATRSSLLRRFVLGWSSWIHVLFDKSYTMKMGEIHTPAMKVYVPNELPLVRRVMEAEAGAFPKHRFMQDLLDPLIGRSVFSANGVEWEEQRIMVNPAFGHTQLRSVFPMMAAAVDDLVARVGAQDLSAPVAIDPLMTHVAADIIYRTLFSVTLDADGGRRIFEAFHDYQRQAQRAAVLRLYGMPTLGFQRRARRAAERIHAVFAPIVHKRYEATRARGERGHDILQSLINAEHPETGRTFTESEVMEQVSTIFLAGHETAASALTWALYLLACDPELQEQVRAEAGDIVDEFDDLRRLAITRNVFRETLRLYPPLAFLLRESGCQVQMRDKVMPEGALLVVSPWLIQRNRDNFPEPHGFDPARFDDPAQAAACRHAYLPFGKGPRVCVGAGFAQQEALLVLTALTRAFRLAPVAGDVPEPISRLTLRAKTGVRLQLNPIFS